MDDLTNELLRALRLCTSGLRMTIDILDVDGNPVDSFKDVVKMAEVTIAKAMKAQTE